MSAVCAPRSEFDAALAVHLPWLRRVSQRLFRGCGRLDAADIVQEVLLDICRTPGGFCDIRPEEQIAWLKRVLVRKVANARRDQSRAKRDQNRDVPLDAAEAGDRLTDPSPPPGSRVARSELEDRLAAAVQRLCPAQQAVVRLYFWEGQTLHTIAGLLKSDPTSVWRLLKRGVAEVKEQVIPDIDRPDDR